MDVFSAMEGDNNQEVKIKEVTSRGVPLNNKIALIDADTIVYIACLHTIQQEELLPKWAYSEEVYNELTSDSAYDEETHSIIKGDVEGALQLVEEKIEYIKELTGCQKVELHFTTGKNFRYDLNQFYKANRLTLKRPPHLEEVKKLAVKRFKGFLWGKVEADDIVVYKKKKYPYKYLLVAMDKDVLYTIKGRHFNYYERENIAEPKFVEVTKNEAEWFPVIQTILGDTIDNIKGCKGIGLKRLISILNKDYDLDIPEVTKAQELLQHLPEWSKYRKTKLMYDIFKLKNQTNKDVRDNYDLVNLHTIKSLRPFKLTKHLERRLND